MNDMSDQGGTEPLFKGTEVSCYRIEKILGRGGFGITYLATDINLQRLVALKEFFLFGHCHRDAQDCVQASSEASQSLFDWGLKSFLKESQMLARFEHPNIVRVHASFQANGTAYMAMAYESGVDLATAFRDQSTRSQQYLESIIFPIIDGLKLVHERGFLHRDIKPSNILIRDDGSPVLLDFGSARPAPKPGLSLSPLTSLVTPGYAPPEQYSDEYGIQGAWTDIYALAATLYAGVTQQAVSPACDRVSVSADTVISNTLLPELQAVDPEQFSDTFLRAIEAGLAPDIDQRPQSLDEWIKMLKGSSNNVGDRGVGSLFGVLGGVLVLLAVGLGYYYQKHNSVDDAMDVSDAQPSGAGEVSLDSSLAGNHVITITSDRLQNLYSELTRLTKKAQDFNSIIPASQFESISVLIEELNNPELTIDQSATAKTIEVELAQLDSATLSAKRGFDMGSGKDERQEALDLCLQTDRDCKINDIFLDEDDEKFRRVALSPFTISRNEITHQEFEQYVQATGYVTEAELAGFSYRCCTKGISIRTENLSWRNADLTIRFPNIKGGLPVTHMSLKDAQGYCQWKGGRLPSEAEWEYAVRGPQRHVFAWGKEWLNSDNPLLEKEEGLKQGFYPEYVEQTSGFFVASGYAGGVWEWVTTEDEKQAGVLKGGSFLQTKPLHFRAALRKITPTHLGQNDDGFRCVNEVSIW